MADPISLGVMVGTTVLGGALSAQGAATKAEGERTNIQGQMLATTGRAFQFDVESQEYRFKSDVETYQAAISRLNRQVAIQNANWERVKGEVEAEQAGMENRFQLASAKAAQGASGIDVNSASSTRVRESMVEVGAYNQAVIRSNAAHIAYGYDVTATNLEAQAAVHDMTASLDKAQAANATTAAGLTRQGLTYEEKAMDLASTTGALGVESSLVSAAGSVSSKWMQASYMGMTPGSTPTSPGPALAPVTG